MTQDSIYSIRDSVDSFSVRRNGKEVVLTFEDGTTETLPVQDEFRGFLYIVAQMFFDHEGRFEDIDEALLQKVYPMFDNMIALSRAR